MEVNNAEVRKNLEILINAVENHADPLFSLDSYRKTLDCGTLYCTAGLMATIPFFMEKGFRFGESTNFDKNFVYYQDQSLYSAEEKIEHIFGAESFSRLFQERGFGDFDEEYPDSHQSSDPDIDYTIIPSSVTDKELALWRLRKQLEIYQD